MCPMCGLRSHKSRKRRDPEIFVWSNQDLSERDDVLNQCISKGRHIVVVLFFLSNMYWLFQRQVLLTFMYSVI